jgi:hypothetical protein
VTRLELEQATYRRTNKNTSSVDTATQTRIRHFLNARYRRLLALPGLEVLRRSVSTFDSVADTSTFTLAGVSAVTRVWEATNDRELEWMTLAEYRAVSPDPTAVTGSPTHVVFRGFEADTDWLGVLYPTPTDVITYLADTELYLSDLAADGSSPVLIPDDFHFLLELGATMDEFVKTDDGRYTTVKAEYEAGLRDLRYRLARQRASAPGPKAMSSLGSWFPADRWVR